ncbi:MAG: mechanosensitive ion channel family protein [Sulfurifustaceae bacterium]
MENFVATVSDSVRDAIGPIMAAIPKIIGFVIILVAGWIIAGLIARGVAMLLRSIKFNELSDRSGFSDFVGKMGMAGDASSFIGLTAKWFIRLIALIVAFDALGLTAVSDVLRSLLLWLPNVVVALVVLVIGGLAANAVANVVRASAAKAGLGSPNLLANIARGTIVAFAVIVAVNQIGVAQSLINTLFMATVAAIALAVGLSFGLGGRDTAGEIVRNWYRQGQEARPRLQRAAAEAKAEAKEEAQRRGARTVPDTRDETRHH